MRGKEGRCGSWEPVGVQRRTTGKAIEMDVIAEGVIRGI